MKKSAPTEIKRGQAVSFRIPSDAPDHLLKHLQKLKELERRNFSSKIAEFVMQGVGNSFSRERETITIPLPNKLSKSQRDWLKHEHSEAVLGSIIYQLLTEPVRATALLASLNSNSLDINQALFLQEEIMMEENSGEISKEDSHLNFLDEIASTNEFDSLDDGLEMFDWEKAKHNQPIIAKEENEDIENDLDSILGDFLSKMNK